MSNDVKLEQAVMVCPQCEGEGGYPDGLDESACHTDCTRCGGNGWIVDLAAWNARHQPQREAVLEEAARRLEREWPGPASNIVRALKATPAPAAEREAVSVEEAAQRIYEHYEFGIWSPGEKPAWVPDGNSEMQHVARAFARAALKTSPASAVSRDEIVAVLERCRDREYNPFEPDNQTTLHGDLCTILSRLQGDKT